MDMGPLVPEEGVGLLVGAGVLYLLMLALTIAVAYVVIRAAVRSGTLAALRQHDSERAPRP